jgi:uncharacterized membrane protein YeiB
MVIVVILGQAVLMASDFGPAGTARHAAFNLLRQVLILAHAATYMIVLIWLARLARLETVFGPLRAVGRLSLTNYVLQSVAMFLVLYGAGLRLAGDVGATVVVLLALVVFAMQAFFSTLYVRHFKRGPLEHLWRILTYGNRAERPIPVRERPA